MAIDSRRKRAGAGGLHWMPSIPTPDGTIDAADRAQVTGVYPGFWYGVSGRIIDWLGNLLDGVADPGATLMLNVVRPGIIDPDESRIADSDVFIVGIDQQIKTESTRPSRLATALLRLYGIVRELPADTAADTVLSRLTETIRRTILAGNVRGKACDGLALNLDCPVVGIAPAPGCSMTIVDVMVKYFLEN